MTKRIYRIHLLLVMALTTVLSGFSFTAITQAQSAHVSLWYAADPTDPFRTVLQGAVDKFNATHNDLQFDLTAIPGATFSGQFGAALSGGSVPDVFWTNGGNALQTLVNSGIAAEIPQLNDAARGRFAPGAFDSTTFGGKHYAVPVSLAGVFMWYNADLFAAHNIELPTTWSKLIAACQQFTAAGITPVALGNNEKWPGALWLTYLTTRIDGTATFREAVNRAQPGAFTNPAFVQAGRRIQEAVQAHCFEPNFNTTADADARLLLANGKAAMQVQGTWNLGGLKQANQEITQKSIRILPFPVAEGGTGNPKVMVGGTEVAFAISTKAPPNTTAALLELLTSDDFVRSLAENDIIPARLGSIQSIHEPLKQSMANALAEAPALQLYYDQLLPSPLAAVHLDTTQQLFGLMLTPEQAANAMEQARAQQQGQAQAQPQAQPPATPINSNPTQTPIPAPLRQLAQSRNLSIGAAVAVAPLRSDAKYQATLKREFNMLTPENALKIANVHPSRTRYDFSDADAVVNFATANGMQVRGHTLVYGKYLPDWLDKGQFSRDEMLNILHEYIQTIVGRYKGRIAVWDVVNEAVDDNGALRDTVFLRTIGPDYITYAFQWAHEADPQAQLFYNDFGGEDLGQKSNAIYALLQDLIKRGVPINGVGLQMHLSLTKPLNMSDVAANINRLGALGLQVHITELDVETKGSPGSTQDHLQAQATVYREVTAACLHSSACKAIVTWGFTDQFTWLTGDIPLPFDKTYQPKPAYYALEQALMQP